MKPWEGFGTETQRQLPIYKMLFSLSWTLLPVLHSDFSRELVGSSNQNGFPACQLRHACCRRSGHLRRRCGSQCCLVFRTVELAQVSTFLSFSLEVLLHLPDVRRHTAGQWCQCGVRAPALRFKMQRACCLLLLGAYLAGRLLAAESYWLQVTQQKPSSTTGGHRSVAGGLLGHSTSRLFLELALANPMVFAQLSLLLGSGSFLVQAVFCSAALSQALPKMF